MKKLLSLLLLLLFFAGQAPAQLNSMQGANISNIPYVCQHIELEKPPFFISDEYKQGDKIWENFRKLENQDVADRYIPRGSIVYTPPSLYDKLADSDRRVPVRILSLPSKENEDRIRESRVRENGIGNMISTIGSKKRVEMNAEGWIDKKSIRKAGDYTFFVTKDAPLHKSPGGISLNENPIYLSLTPDGKYNANRCCTPDSYEGEEQCFDKYKFIVHDMANHKEEEFVITDLECSLVENLAPIANDIAVPFKSILDVMRVNTPGMAIDQLELLPSKQYWRNGKPVVTRQEMIKVKIDDETGEGPFGSFHYRPDDKVSSDLYLKPNSHCAFLRVLEQHNKDCTSMGCQVQFGDMYHSDSWGVHQGHDSGECIDIRPLRKMDDGNSGLTYKHGRYDREKTKAFITLLKKAGARFTMFNDKQITGLSRDASVHDDHIHVCFGENREKVQTTCQQGFESTGGAPATSLRPVPRPDDLGPEQ